MKLTYYGHSAFRVDVEGASILIDPYLADNPLVETGVGGPGRRA